MLFLLPLVVWFQVTESYCVSENKGVVISWEPEDKGLEILNIVQNKKDGSSKGFTYLTPLNKYLIYCQQTLHMYDHEFIPKIDIITEEERVLVDRLFVTNCNDYEIKMSVAPAIEKYGGERQEHPPRTKEFFYFKDMFGNCYLRQYDVNIMGYSGTITRHDVTPTDCPPSMKQDMEFTKFGDSTIKGIVVKDEWIPSGKEILHNYTRPGEKKEYVSYTALEWNVKDDPKWKKFNGIECFRVTRPSEESFYMGYFIKHFVLDIITQRVVMDTFILNSCEFESIQKSFYFHFKKDQISLIFKNTEGLCYRREYNVDLPHSTITYQIVEVERKIPSYLGCPKELDYVLKNKKDSSKFSLLGCFNL